MFLQNLFHTGAENFRNNKGCRMQAIWFVSPPHNGPSITRAPPLIVQRRLQQRGRKLAAARCESDQRPKDWETNLLLSSRCEIPPTNRFHGITLTWPDSIRRVGESDQNYGSGGLIYLVAIAIPGDDPIWPGIQAFTLYVWIHTHVGRGTTPTTCGLEAR